MVDPAGLLIGGLAGYVLGHDGKVAPIDYGKLAELIRSNKPEFIKAVSIDTSEVRDRLEYQIAGNFIYVENPATPTTSVYIHLNEKEWPRQELTKLRRMKGPFYRFFITNAAGSGVLNLVVCRGFLFEFIEGEVNTVPNMNLNGLQDVSVVSPADGDLFYWDNAASLWKSKLITTFLHATGHEPGGGDAMAVDAAVGTGSLRTLGTGAQQAAAGDHTHTLTVTEAIAATSNYTTQNTYQTLATVSIPASAQKVIMWGTAGRIFGATLGYCRGLYNGVQRFEVSGTYFGTSSGGRAQWSGDGIGSSATALLEYKSDTSGQTSYAAGGAFHIAS